MPGVGCWVTRVRAATLSAAASRQISPHLELCWRTHNKHLARAAVLGWAGLVLGSFTYKRSIWSFIKAGTRTRLGSRLTPGPASPDAAAGTRLHREPHLFLFSQVSVKFYHHGGPADDVTSWPAVAAAPSSQLQLWGCDDDDSAGTLPQSSVVRSRPSTSHHPWTLQLQD